MWEKKWARPKLCALKTLTVVSRLGNLAFPRLLIPYVANAKETKIINYAEPLVARPLILHGSTIIQSHIFLSLIGLLMVQLFLEAISRYVKDKKVSKGSQHWFAKGKSCLTNLIAFYDGTAGWIDEERAKDVVHLHFSKVFNTVSHTTLIGKARAGWVDGELALRTGWVAALRGLWSAAQS